MCGYCFLSSRCRFTCSPIRQYLPVTSPPLGVTTKRQLRSDKLAPDEEERVGPSLEEAKYVQELEKALAGEPESMEKETEQFNLLNDREQLVKSVASGKEKEQLELQKAWEQSSKSLPSELEKASTEELKALPKGQRGALKSAETAHFKDVLEGSKRPQDTLENYYKDTNQAEVFVKETDSTVLRWLREKKSPEEVFVSLKLDRDNLFKKPISTWLNYVEAFNDVYPTSAKPLLTILGYIKVDQLQDMLFFGLLDKPQKGTPKYRVLNELFQSWVGSKPPVSASDAYTHLGLLTQRGIKFNSARFAAWMSYIDLINVSKPQKNVSYMSILESLYDTHYLVEMLLEETGCKRWKKLEKDFISHLEEKKRDLSSSSKEKVDELLNLLKARQKMKKILKRKAESPP